MSIEHKKQPNTVDVLIADDTFVGEQAIASGWGTLEEDGKPACILQEVTLPVMSNEECKQTNYSSKMISDNMLCAGYLEGKKDSCQVREQMLQWFLKSR